MSRRQTADRNASEKVKAAREKSRLYMDYVLETYEAPDFVDVLGVLGGGEIRMRFHDDGRVTER